MQLVGTVKFVMELFSVPHNSNQQCIGDVQVGLYQQNTEKHYLYGGEET